MSPTATHATLTTGSPAFSHSVRMSLRSLASVSSGSAKMSMVSNPMAFVWRMPWAVPLPACAHAELIRPSFMFAPSGRKGDREQGTGVRKTSLPHSPAPILCSLSPVPCPLATPPLPLTPCHCTLSGPDGTAPAPTDPADVPALRRVRLPRDLPGPAGVRAGRPDPGGAAGHHRRDHGRPRGHPAAVVLHAPGGDRRGGDRRRVPLRDRPDLGP